MKTKFMCLILLCASLLLSLYPCYATETESDFIFPTETNDIIELYNTVSSQIPKFDKEFDTEQSYKDKIKSLNLNFPDTYIFNVEDFNVKYILEEQCLNVSPKYNIFKKRIIIKTNYKKDSYDATNMGGAQIKVYVTNSDSYGIRMVNNIKKTFRFNLPPEEAKTLKENIKIIIFCNIKQSSSIPYFVFKDYSYSAPTFNLPYEHNEYYYDVSVKVTRLVVFDNLNKKVLADEKR